MVCLTVAFTCSFKALKYFMQYVDELDHIVENRAKDGFTKSDFKDILQVTL
jgi:hypothetical protein